MTIPELIAAARRRTLSDADVAAVIQRMAAAEAKAADRRRASDSEKFLNRTYTL